MKLQINIDNETTSNDCLALVALFTALSGAPKAQVKSVCDLDRNPTVPAQEPAAAPAVEATATATKRSRRTKAEIEAEAAAPVVAPQVEVPVVTEVIDTQTGEITQAAEEFETAGLAVTNGKTYGEAEVQQLATIIARTKGPQVVKDKIAELGAPRIAALTPEQLNTLGAFLESQK